MTSFDVNLTAEAVALRALARDGTRKGRSELAHRVVGMFGRPELFLSTAERALVYDILHALILGVEVSIRREISTILSIQKDAPRDLIIKLAYDEIDVAFPVLARSGVLDDVALIDIIRDREADHHLAIVGRPALSGQVSAMLAGTGNEEVIVALLRNKGAIILPPTMLDLVERSETVEAYRRPLLDRDDLDSSLALRMFFWVSNALRDHIVEKYRFDGDLVEDLVGQVVMHEVRKIAENKRSRHEVTAEMKKLMQREGEITPDMLILALREGEVPLFTGLFGKMTGLGERIIGRILFEQEGKGLAMACREAGIGRVSFTSIFALAQKMRAANTANICRHLPVILSYYDKIVPEASAEVLDHWRRGADFAGALRAVERKFRLTVA